MKQNTLNYQEALAHCQASPENKVGYTNVKGHESTAWYNGGWWAVEHQTADGAKEDPRTNEYNALCLFHPMGPMSTTEKCSWGP